MILFKLYEHWEEATFIGRLNRFVMVLEKDDVPIKAYIPNPGRMAEFLFRDQKFFITRSTTSKFGYRVVATTYQNAFVFLDTTRINDLFLKILKNKLIEDFQNAEHVRREVSFDHSRFDFTLSRKGTNAIIEVKSCTLCHNGVAMFPDAPTMRGQRHIVELEELAHHNHRTYVIFLITNSNARIFLPNFHTDFDYGKAFLSSKGVQFKAFKLHFVDPVSVDLESIEEIRIDTENTQQHCTNRGTYVLVLENSRRMEVQIGRLGRINFDRGFYVYIGSGLHSLDARVRRHLARRKKRFWHIDYIAPQGMNIKKVYLIRRNDRIESQLSTEMLRIGDDYIEGFGSSDTEDCSHLFYFRKEPYRDRRFLNIILNFQTSIGYPQRM